MRATDISERAHLWLRLVALAIIVGAAAIPSSRHAAQASASADRAGSVELHPDDPAAPSGNSAARAARADASERAHVQVASVDGLDLGAAP